MGKPSNRKRKSHLANATNVAKRKEVNERIEELKQSKFITGMLLVVLPLAFGIILLIMSPGMKQEINSEEPGTIVENVASNNQQFTNEKVGNKDEKANDSRTSPKNSNFESKMETNEQNEDDTLVVVEDPLEDEEIRNLVENFKATILDSLRPGSVQVEGRTVTATEIKPKKDHNSSVRVYKIENFLTNRECDGLMNAHIKHVQVMNKNTPIICFDSLSTLQKHLSDNNKDWKITNKDFTPDTKCMNTSLSADLQKVLKWSYSTSFYPSESPFSIPFQDRVYAATGLDPSSGGKFQITSYFKGIGYKSHTDCILDSAELRDRVATILVYLQDVQEGGETEFVDLGITVKPKKGMAIFWNNMDKRGNCEPLSLHRAAEVKAGQKFILQRWYYYKSFYHLGKRPPAPHIPAREPKTARVSCDEYEHGSCRWYDEWNYDHINQYNKMKRNLT